MAFPAPFEEYPVSLAPQVQTILGMWYAVSPICRVLSSNTWSVLVRLRIQILRQSVELLKKLKQPLRGDGLGILWSIGELCTVSSGYGAVKVEGPCNSQIHVCRDASRLHPQRLERPCRAIRLHGHFCPKRHEL